MKNYYKIYELKTIKNSSKYYFIGAFKNEAAAKDFRLMNIDIEELLLKNIATVTIKYGKILKEDIMDLKINGLKAADKEGIDEITNLFEKYTKKQEENIKQ